ncbi:hypothetical protein ABID92_000003 [Frigoribacterium sp. PvP120]|uniref:hypothetical protein n=1 Tax=unclassified Frigoribacterium TaxID=2627005 RepID=UPI001AEA5B5D|nr:hypothetical protein [Frigoribacterium sp. PvP121]MBP1242170.1 hypothetical protein [Frigoribacterium sp. PvP121]
MQQIDDSGHARSEHDGSDDRPPAVPGLEARLRQVEKSPLESRAGSFAALHDELRGVLEGTTADGAAGPR